MRSPLFQYQGHAESYDDSAGYAYSVALMDWWLPWPDFAPARRPNVAEGWFAFGGEQGAVIDIPEGVELAIYPFHVFRHPRVYWPNLPVIHGDWIATPPDPPAIGPPGLTPPLIDRDPDAPIRTRRHLDRVADILNSLLRQGVIVQTAAKEFVIFRGQFAEARDPGLDDGTSVGAFVGATWTNTVTGDYFRCTDATQGVAVWVEV